MKMNIVYCCDWKALSGLEASIYSLLTHNKNANIYVFHMDYIREETGEEYNQIPPIAKEKLSKIVKYLDPNSRIIFLDAYPYYEQYFLHGVAENDGHSSPLAPIRLVLDIALPFIDHCLYLDADTIIQGDVRSMYFSYLDRIAESEYCYAGYHIPLDGIEHELVASVLLFDLKKCKDKKFLEKARYNITHNHYMWYDQSALEDTGDCVLLPETYNFMKEYEDRLYEPIILHFADKLSPKIYDRGAEYFYRRFPHLDYIQKGLKNLDSFNMVYPVQQ